MNTKDDWYCPATDVTKLVGFEGTKLYVSSRWPIDPKNKECYENSILEFKMVST